VWIPIPRGWLFKHRGNPADYIDIAAQDVDAVVARFQAIGEDPANFDNFVRSIQNDAPTIAQDCA